MHSVSLHGEGMRSGRGGPPRPPYPAPPRWSKDLWVILRLSQHSVWTAAWGKKFWTRASKHGGIYQAQNQHTWMDGHTHTQLIHWLGHQIYALFPGGKTLPQPRKQQPWFPLRYLMSGQSQLCDGLCAKTPLWSKPLQGWGIWIFVWKERVWRSLLRMCFSVSAWTSLNLDRTELHTPWHRVPLQNTDWGGGKGSKCVNVWVCVWACAGTKPKSYLTFWLSMPPREPLGLGLEDKENKCLCF